MYYAPLGLGQVKGLKDGKYKVLFRNYKNVKLLDVIELADSIADFLGTRDATCDEALRRQHSILSTCG